MVYFNSIKVRLEPSGGAVAPPLECQFQFHKGTIRTYKYMKSIADHSFDFNSIKVRLEPIYRVTTKQ